MTEDDHVKDDPRRRRTAIRMRDVCWFYLGPRAGKAEVSSRIRLNGTQRVVAVAQLSDGTFWSDAARHRGARGGLHGRQRMMRGAHPAAERRGAPRRARSKCGVVIQHPMETGFRLDAYGNAHPAQRHPFARLSL